jgi:hypothetical protein
MKWLKVIAITVAVISAVVFMTFPRGSAIVKSQPGCPANKSAFKVDYFGLPLKNHWICEISQELPRGGETAFYKADSIFKAAADGALGLALVLLPALY